MLVLAADTEAEAASQSSLTLACTPASSPATLASPCCTRPALRQAHSAPDLSCTRSTLHSAKSIQHQIYPAPGLSCTRYFLTRSTCTRSMIPVLFSSCVYLLKHLHQNLHPACSTAHLPTFTREDLNNHGRCLE